MKKTGINLIIGTLISIVLIVLALIIIKPNMTYLIKYNNNTYSSKDNITFRVIKNDDSASYDNEIISFEEIDGKMHISVPTKTYDSNKMVYTKEDGSTIIAHNGKIIEGKIKDGNIETTGLDGEEIIILMQYSSLLNVAKVDNDRINVTNQKIICFILSVFIAFILSFLAYPAILFDKIKETKNLALICIPMTLILCLASAFYIYFTLK